MIFSAAKVVININYTMTLSDFFRSDFYIFSVWLKTHFFSKPGKNSPRQNKNL